MLTRSYGFQSASKIRIVVSVALVDALIKDSDITAVSAVSTSRRG